MSSFHELPTRPIPTLEEKKFPHQERRVLAFRQKLFPLLKLFLGDHITPAAVESTYLSRVMDYYTYNNAKEVSAPPKVIAQLHKIEKSVFEVLRSTACGRSNSNSPEQKYRQHSFPVSIGELSPETAIWTIGKRLLSDAQTAEAYGLKSVALTQNIVDLIDKGMPESTQVELPLTPDVKLEFIYTPKTRRYERTRIDPLLHVRIVTSEDVV